MAKKSAVRAAGKGSRSKAKAPRPRMPLASEAMKRWSALLSDELATWPRVTAKRFFGVLGIYRGKQIFAALPDKRAMHSANSILVRFQERSPKLLARAASDPRMSSSEQDRFWYPFEIETDADLRDAIALLAEAYEAAGPRHHRKNKT